MQTVIGIEGWVFFQCGATITSNRTSSEVPRKHLLISSAGHHGAGSHQGPVERQGLPPGAAPVPITIPVSHLALNGSPVSTTLGGF